MSHEREIWQDVISLRIFFTTSDINKTTNTKTNENEQKRTKLDEIEQKQIEGRIRTSFGLSFEVVSRFVKQQNIA